MATRTPYAINLKPRYAPLELVDVQALNGLRNGQVSFRSFLSARQASRR